MRGVRVLNPIIDWSDSDVWDYLHDRGIEANPLYKEGWTRIGCVGCPLAGRRARELAFARYPKLYKAWHDAIAYVIARRRRGYSGGLARAGGRGCGRCVGRVSRRASAGRMDEHMRDGVGGAKKV